MTTETSPTMRRCIGSSRFGIEAHEAPADEFPEQPSQKDGLGRMCKPHWRAYTNALRKHAVARRAESDPEPEPDVIETPDEAPEPEMRAPRRARREKVKAEPMGRATSA